MCMEKIQEIPVGFAGLFQNTTNAKTLLLVSVYHFSGWREAKFLENPTTGRVIEFNKLQSKAWDSASNKNGRNNNLQEQTFQRVL